MRRRTCASSCSAGCTRCPPTWPAAPSWPTMFGCSATWATTSASSTRCLACCATTRRGDPPSRASRKPRSASISTGPRCFHRATSVAPGRPHHGGPLAAWCGGTPRFRRGLGTGAPTPWWCTGSGRSPCSPSGWHTRSACAASASSTAGTSTWALTTRRLGLAFAPCFRPLTASWWSANTCLTSLNGPEPSARRGSRATSPWRRTGRAP